MVWVALGVAATVIALVLAARSRGVRPSFTSLALTAIATYASYWTWFLLDGAWYVRVLLTVVLAVPLMSLANAAFRADIRRTTTRRSEVATGITERVLRDGDAGRRFALYLRPFTSTDRLPAQSLPASFTMDIPVHVDFESLLARALREECPLIALGRPGEVDEGAGRVAVPEDRWRDVVDRLADRATLLVIVPSANPGTLWELGELRRRGRLDRTLVVMPEQAREAPSGVIFTTQDDRLFDVGIRRYSGAEHSFDFAAEWDRAVLGAAESGIRLPPYAGSGALFTLDPHTAEPQTIVPLALAVVSRRVRYLREIVHALGLLPGDARDPMAAYEAAVVRARRTREYALVVAADAYRTWGDEERSRQLLARGREAAGRRAPFVDEYEAYIAAEPPAG